MQDLPERASKWYKSQRTELGLIKKSKIMLEPSQVERALVRGPEYELREILVNGAGQKRNQNLKSKALLHTFLYLIRHFTGPSLGWVLGCYSTRTFLDLGASIYTN